MTTAPTHIVVVTLENENFGDVPVATGGNFFATRPISILIGTNRRDVARLGCFAGANTLAAVEQSPRNDRNHDVVLRHWTFNA